jgi:hypothetical protein
VVFFHEDQPIVVPIELFNGAETVLPVIDRVVTKYRVIIEKGLWNRKAAIGEPGFYLLISDAIECLGRGVENRDELLQVKGLKLHAFCILSLKYIQKCLFVLVKPA